jgi:membrane associated rhomboid family serine protease
MHRETFFPLVTWIILMVNITVFIFSFRNFSELFLSIFNWGKYTNQLIPTLGLSPGMVVREPYILVTHMFIHDGWLHIIMNMLIFVGVGILLEKRIGSLNFALLYLFSGFFAVLFNLLTRFIFNLPHIVSVGSSGAIFGIVYVAALVCSDKEIPIIFIPILNLFSIFLYLANLKIKVSLLTAAIFFTAFSLLMMIVDIGNLTQLTHFGGIVGGLLYFWVMSPRKDRGN